jgi:hypothetical protein
MSQILMPRHSSCDHSSSTLQNSTTNSSITSTQKVSSGERPSTNSMAEDTAARSTASSPTTSVWQRLATLIPSSKKFLAHGRSTMARHSLEPQAHRRDNSFTARRVALRAISFSFRACIALLWAWFATRLDASSGRLMPHGTQQAPQVPTQVCERDEKMKSRKMPKQMN